MTPFGIARTIFDVEAKEVQAKTSRFLVVCSKLEIRINIIITFFLAVVRTNQHTRIRNWLLGTFSYVMSRTSQRELGS